MADQKQVTRPHSRPLEGRVAIITGAGHGLGEAHARALAAAGAKVVINDRGVGWHGTEDERSRAADAVARIVEAGGVAVADTGDVGDWAAAKELVDAAVREFGRLDILVCNAGIARKGPVDELTEADWDAVQHVHVRGTFAPVHFAVAYWRAHTTSDAPPSPRRIITTGSRAAFYTSSQDAGIAYATAKGAIHAFTLALAGELEPLGITANCVVPTALTGPVEAVPAWARDPELLARRLPEHVSPMVVFLASDQAADITGGLFYSGAGEMARFREREVAAHAVLDHIWSSAELAEWFSRDTGLRYRPPAIDPITASQTQGCRNAIDG